MSLKMGKSPVLGVQYLATDLLVGFLPVCCKTKLEKLIQKSTATYKYLNSSTKMCFTKIDSSSIIRL